MAVIRQTDAEIALLRFEESHPTSGRAKDAAIARELDMSPRQYYRWLRLVVHDAGMFPADRPSGSRAQLSSRPRPHSRSAGAGRPVQ
jgi:hypothetical protein